MKKIAFAFIATFGLFASALASEKTATLKPEKGTSTASVKRSICTIEFKVYRNGFLREIHEYTSFTDGNCTTFFNSMKNMMTEQGYHVH